jgi:hypothetical protein
LDQEVHRERSGKQSSSSWYQSARLITVQIVVVKLVLHRLGDEYVDGVLSYRVGVAAVHLILVVADLN